MLAVAWCAMRRRQRTMLGLLEGAPSNAAEHGAPPAMGPAPQAFALDGLARTRDAHAQHSARNPVLLHTASIVRI